MRFYNLYPASKQQMIAASSVAKAEKGVAFRANKIRKELERLRCGIYPRGAKFTCYLNS